MPTHRLHPLHGFSEKPQIGSSPKVFHKIEAHAADAAFVHLLKLLVSIRFIDDRGAAVAPVRARDVVERGAHVRSMAARVHDDGPFNSQHVMQFPQSFERCVRRAIGSIGGIGKLRRRPENMAVRIAGERRQLEFRCASVRVGRCCGFHGVHVLYGPMKLGMFMMPLHPPQRKPAETYAEDREAVLLADRLGYCEALVGEHVTDLAENVTSCLMFLASLAHDTKNIVLGSGTINMPNTHPAHVAAQVAMIDHLLKGRFIMGISPGGLMSDAEAFGNYKKDRNAIFLESINMVLDLWAGSAPYNLSGQFFSVTTANTQIPEIGQGAILKPYQKPHPPIVVTAVAPHSKGVTEAAKRGWTPISANFLLPEWVASHWPKYVEGRKAVGAEPRPSEWRVAKSIFVADDDKVAQRYGLAAEGPYHFYFRQLVRKLVGFGGRSNLFKLDQSQPDSSITADTITPKLVLAGTVASVVDQILAFRETTGDFGTLYYACHDWVDPALGRRSMQLMAEQVMPRVNAAIAGSGMKVASNPR